MVETTGGFTSAGLAREAEALVLPSLTQAQAIEIGEIGAGSVFHAEPDAQGWGGRKVCEPPSGHGNRRGA